jgi:hypothetical protein
VFSVCCSVPSAPGATARPAFADGGFVVGTDGGVVGEMASDALLPIECGGFTVPVHLADSFKGFMTRNDVIRHEVIVDMKTAHDGCTRGRLASVGASTISRDDRSGDQAPDQAHNLETRVRIALPQPTIGG